MPNIMDLMREYKHLKQQKQAQGSLPETDEIRLREVHAYLQGTLGARKNAASVKVETGSAPAESHVAAPRVSPTPAQHANPVASAVPAAANPADVPQWQRQKDAEAERRRRAEEQLRVSVPEEFASNSVPNTEVDVPGVAPSQTGVKRQRPHSQSELEKQLNDVHGQSMYTSTHAEDMLGDFYYSYLSEGYEIVKEDVAFDPIDPREQELRDAGLLSSTGLFGEGTPSITAVPGGVFLDDFMSLYENGILPKPSEDDVVEIFDANALVQGRRKVTLHMLNGEVKRGSVGKILRSAAGFSFKPQRGPAEELAFASIKAMFIMSSGSQNEASAAQGNKINVEFTDRRRIAGLSPDYQPGAPLFTLYPSGPGNFESIIVNAAAVARIA